MSWRYGFDWYQNHWYRFSGLPVINIGHISGRFKSLCTADPNRASSRAEPNSELSWAEPRAKLIWANRVKLRTKQRVPSRVQLIRAKRSFEPNWLRTKLSRSHCLSQTDPRKVESQVELRSQPASRRSPSRSEAEQNRADPEPQVEP